MRNISTKTLSVSVILIMGGLFISATLGEKEKVITLEAFIDGRSALVLSRDGFTWHHSKYSRPGIWENKEYPTYINEKEWVPDWEDDDPRGKGKSSLYKMKNTYTVIGAKIMNCSNTRDSDKVIYKYAIKFMKDGVEIEDVEGGPHWYKVQIIVK